LDRGKIDNINCEWCGKSFSEEWGGGYLQSGRPRRFCRNSSCARESCLYITRINKSHNDIYNDPKQVEICRNTFKLFMINMKKVYSMVEI
jgi:hypothetical protein